MNESLGGEKKKITRRNVLRLAGAGIATIPTAKVASTYILNKQIEEKGPEGSADLEARRKNIAEMSSKYATYRIEYNSHYKISTPEILSGADAVVLERMGSYSPDDIATNIGEKMKVDFPVGDKNVSAHPYRDIIDAAKENKTPIFLADISFALKEDYDESVATEFRKRLETFLGGTMMALYADEIAAVTVNSGETRREFLVKSATMAAGASLLYLSSDAPEQLANLVSTKFKTENADESSMARKIEKFFGNLNGAMHPENSSLLLDTRNVLIAQKTEHIAAMLARQLGKSPTIAIEIGASHFGIERDLLDTELNRVAKLKNDLGVERLKRESLIARVDFEDTGFIVTLYKDPALAS